MLSLVTLAEQAECAELLQGLVGQLFAGLQAGRYEGRADIMPHSILGYMENPYRART